eukprot:jgi/Galph1/695/GphlegSOOS_G5489.1
MSLSKEVHSVTVYGASSSGVDERYVKAIAKNGWTLINGGGRYGMMGATTDGALEAGGKVNAVIAQYFLSKVHPNLNEVVVVDNLTERKQKLLKTGEALIVAPGGFGTLDEAFEALCLSQIGLIKKSVIFLNVLGFFDSLQSFFNKLEKEKFISENSKSFCLFTKTVDQTIQCLQSIFSKSEIRRTPSEKSDSFTADWTDIEVKCASSDKAIESLTLHSSSFLKHVGDKSRQFVEKRGWTKYNTPRNVLLAMIGEVGELAECFQWKDEVSVNLPELTPKEKEHISEEMADVFIYLVRLSEVCGIHLESAVARKLEKNEEKVTLQKFPFYVVFYVFYL